MKKLFFVLFAGLLLGFSQPVSAQVEYTYFDNRDGVLAEYRWQRSHPFKKGSDAMLNIQLTNQSAYSVEVVFSLGFYNDNQLMLESRGNRVCIKPGQRIRGHRAGLRFSAEGISLEMAQAAWFSWDLFDFEVKEVPDCK